MPPWHMASGPPRLHDGARRPPLALWLLSLVTVATAQETTTTLPAATTTVSTSWVQGMMYPERFECATMTCAAYNPWDLHPVNFTNSSEICTQVLEDMAQGFIEDLPSRCRQLANVGMPYTDCRQDYCAMLDEAVQRLYHMGGPGYYGYELCRPLLDFNRTLCEEEYRDVEALCDCYCPTIPVLVETEDCQPEIFNFLIVGRRSEELQQVFPLNEDCAAYVCDWFEQIGNPMPATPVVGLGFGVPEVCHDLALPFRPEQCKFMVSTISGGDPNKRYEPCPWLEPADVDDVIVCSDGTTHEIDHMEVDSWSVCIEHNFRWQCPANYPVMCDGRNCDGSEDSCCQTTVDRCKSGAQRVCSPALMQDVPEWTGLLTPSATIRRVTTTTMDPESRYGMLHKPTTPQPSFVPQVPVLMPILIMSVGFAGLIGSLVMCFCLCSDTFRTTLAAVTGAARIMKAYKMDPINNFEPSGVAVDPRARLPLPPLKTKEEIESERLDQAACKSLKDAVTAAETRGSCGFIAFDGCPPPAEEASLVEAVATVRSRGIDFMGSNQDLIARADQWLRTLQAERELMRIAARTRPALAVFGQRQDRHLAPGRPWLTTLQGRESVGDLQAEAWTQVEDLAVCLKQAKAAGAQDALIKKEAGLLSELVARIHELPGDRVVLDPDGDGLKLLPRGHRRLLKDTTGEAYTYDTVTRVATDVNDEPPPREELGEVGVDAARPCCAEWVKHRSCKAGRRCPWRHENPRPGDAIRECILARDDDR